MCTCYKDVPVETTPMWWLSIDGVTHGIVDKDKRELCLEYAKMFESADVQLSHVPMTDEMMWMVSGVDRLNVWIKNGGGE